jgi:ABC-2 type transport system permease protein
LFDFFQLVSNENMKIYRRMRTWIMLGILLLLGIAISVLTYVISSGDTPVPWEIMSIEAAILFSLVTIFTVVISADSVAGEFSSGTIKLLLIRPWSRSKILLSKYIALLLFALFFAAALFLVTFVVNLIVYGYDGSYSFPARPGLSPFVYMLAYYGNEFVSLLIVVTLSFMLSTVFRNGGLAIGLSLFILLGGGTFAGILSALDYEWVKYLIFVHMNLNMYLTKTPLIEGLTPGFSIAVLAVYYIIFVVLTWILFNKRDVAA